MWWVFLPYGADIFYSQKSCSNRRSISVPSVVLSLPRVNILVINGEALWHASVLLNVRCVPCIRQWNVPRPQASVALCSKNDESNLPYPVFVQLLQRPLFLCPARMFNASNLDSRFGKASWFTLLQFYNDSDTQCGSVGGTSFVCLRSRGMSFCSADLLWELCKFAILHSIER